MKSGEDPDTKARLMAEQHIARSNFEGSVLGFISETVLNNTKYASVSFTTRQDLPVRAFQFPNFIFCDEKNR